MKELVGSEVVWGGVGAATVATAGLRVNVGFGETPFVLSPDGLLVGTSDGVSVADVEAGEGEGGAVWSSNDTGGLVVVGTLLTGIEDTGVGRNDGVGANEVGANVRRPGEGCAVTVGYRDKVGCDVVGA